MFTCPFGTYAYRRMPFGSCNALATFKRCMLAIFHDMIEESIKVFMDDFSVFRSSFDHCLNNLNKMLQRCKDAHLVLNWEKCHFMVEEGIVLRHTVSEAGLKVDKAKNQRTDKSKITRKQSKASKHGHENQKSSEPSISQSLAIFFSKGHSCISRKLSPKHNDPTTTIDDQMIEEMNGRD
ncbi:reverse transcriptase domain-containing protein [Tanacetum coccineum]